MCAICRCMCKTIRCICFRSENLTSWHSPGYTRLPVSPVRRSLDNEEVHMGNACIFFNATLNFLRNLSKKKQKMERNFSRKSSQPNDAKMKMNVKCWWMMFSPAFFSPPFFRVSAPCSVPTHTRVCIYKPDRPTFPTSMRAAALLPSKDTALLSQLPYIVTTAYTWCYCYFCNCLGDWPLELATSHVCCYKYLYTVEKK